MQIANSPNASLYKVPTLAQLFYFVTSKNVIADIVHYVTRESARSLSKNFQLWKIFKGKLYYKYSDSHSKNFRLWETILDKTVVECSSLYSNFNNF